MMKVSDFYKFIDSIAPFETQMDFDNSGFLIGDEKSDVNRVLISLDVSSDVISECKKLGANLIISHHPVIFHPLRSISKESIPYLLCKNDISVICAHTNLDLAKNGVNYCLFKRLNLNDPSPLSIYNNLPLGLIGYLDSEVDSLSFANFVKYNLNCKNLRFTNLNKNIKKVAVCSGSGGSYIKDVIKNECDAFVTGEIKHSDIILANENSVSVFDVGHFKSENVIVPHLMEILQNRFPMVEFFESNFDDKIQFI